MDRLYSHGNRDIHYFFWVYWNNCLSCKGAASMEAAKNKRFYAIYIGGEGNKKRSMRKGRSKRQGILTEQKEANGLNSSQLFTTRV